MRILHVGWGFSPWRGGGLISYAEDLMAAQQEQGHEVAYFFAGRYYPYLDEPRLKRWRRDGVQMREVINSPVIPGLEHGTRHPERDIGEPRVEAAFGRVLDELRPDVMHVQELLGLPSSVIEIAQRRGVPVVMTLHDYGAVCTTLRLFDGDGQLCSRRDIGADCAIRNADAPRDPSVYIDITLRYEVARARRRLRFGARAEWALNSLVPSVRELGMAGRRPDSWELIDRNAELAAAYQRRRAVNIARLGMADRLLAQSPRLAEIYAELGVASDRTQVLPAPARHIERLRPRRAEEAPARLTFATLNGCASPSKGSRVVVEALHALRARGLEGLFRLKVVGHVHADVAPVLASFEGVEVDGLYDRESLDEVLAGVDVGLMPSMWEEAYGYTGLEMIAKGIPLIANPLGGIVQYALEGETAWLNRKKTGAGLAELMAQLIADPEQVLAMRRRVLERRDVLIPRWAPHVEAIEGIYRTLSAAA